MSRLFVRTRVALLMIGAPLLTGLPALAQHASTSSTDAPPPREVSQFDFLLGEWALVGKPVATTLAERIHGVRELRGTWKAWREFDGRGIEDVLRITDRAGNPRALLHSLRVYDAEKKQWINTALDPYRPSFSASTAQWQGAEMVVSSGGTDSDARAYLSRSRYFEIKPSSFRFQQERSYDGGRTWSQFGVKIEAKRVAMPTAR